MEIKDAARKLYKELIAKFENVNGSGVGIGNKIVIYLETNENLDKIPSNYEGYDVKPSVVGKITAL